VCICAEHILVFLTGTLFEKRKGGRRERGGSKERTRRCPTETGTGTVTAMETPGETAVAGTATEVVVGVEVEVGITEITVKAIITEMEEAG